MKMKSIGSLIKHPIAFILIVLVLILLLLISSKAAQAFGTLDVKQILEVVDGNTLKVSTVEDDTFVVYLKGVDAPELGQAFANESLLYLKKLVKGKNVLVEFSGKDRWGNRLVDVTSPKGNSINEMIIHNGYGWVDRFFLGQTNLMELQETAKSKNIGLWKQTKPLEPWIYYRNQLANNPKGR